MVRFSMLSVVAVLGASMVAAQSPAPVQKSFGVVGLTSEQAPAGTNPVPTGAGSPSYAIVPPANSGNGKRTFQNQLEAPQAGGNAPSVFVLPTPAASACPVSIRAQQRSGGSLITTGRAQMPGPFQRIRLVLDQTGLPARVTSATVTVRGTNGKSRLVNAAQFQMEPQTASPYSSSTLNVVFLSDRGQAEFADLELPGFTSVKSIRLDSIQYADGTTWTREDGRSCRVEPDALMLVRSR